jgi:hypothetical protein
VSGVKKEAPESNVRRFLPAAVAGVILIAIIIASSVTQRNNSSMWSDGFNAGYSQGLSEGNGNQQKIANEEDVQNAFYAGYDAGYAQCTEDSKDLVKELEAELIYYRGVSQINNLLPYERLQNPENWRYYSNDKEKIIHTDWLCPEIKNRDSVFGYNTSGDFAGYAFCKCSISPVFYFLDLETKVFHLDKSHIKIGTLDGKAFNSEFRFVAYDTATKNGYRPCACCEE